MYLIRLIIISLLNVSLLACTPLKRGMDENIYVSTAKPAFSVAVPELELKTSGRFNASITTSNTLGGVPVATWIAVYGGKNMEEAMAIVAQSSLQAPYYWDYNMLKIFSINHGKALLGGFNFQTCTYLIQDLSRDAFASLSIDINTLKSEEKKQKLQWLVRRFATRVDNERGKITLEYREKAPDNFINLNELPSGSDIYLVEFEQRALKAFVFGTWQKNTQNIKMNYPSGIKTRYINSNFLGTISYFEVRE